MFAPPAVTEAPAGDEADGICEYVSGNDQLNVGETGSEVGLHRRRGDVDDEDVDIAHEHGE